MNWIQWNTDIFYAILFCIITSFCFYLPWKVFALSAKKHPAFVFICYRLIPLGFFCFTPFFFLYEALSYFSPVDYKFHRFYPGMVLLGSSKQNQVICSLLFLWFIGMIPFLSKPMIALWLCGSMTILIASLLSISLLTCSSV